MANTITTVYSKAIKGNGTMFIQKLPFYSPRRGENVLKPTSNVLKLFKQF